MQLRLSSECLTYSEAGLCSCGTPSAASRLPSAPFAALFAKPEKERGSTVLARNHIFPDVTSQRLGNHNAAIGLLERLQDCREQPWNRDAGSV